MKEPWMDQAVFRDNLPEFGHFVGDTAGKMSYRQHYNLHFQVPHRHHMGVFQSSHFHLVGQIFQPVAQSRGTLFIYHGYFDHLGLYGFLIQLGLELGFTVVGFDLPGHGLSSGSFASIECFSRYAAAQQHFIEKVQAFDNCPKPWVAAGQSTGAAVIMYSLLQQHVNYYDRLIFLAPLVRVTNWYWVRVLYQVLRHRGGTARTFRNNSANESFVEFLRENDPFQHRRIEAQWVGAMIRYTKKIIKSSPSSHSPLIIQGELDETVDYRFNMPMLKKLFHDPKIILIPGARHHLVNEIDEYKKVIKQEITEFVCF